MMNARAQALRQNKTLRAADVEGEVKFQFLAGAADAEPKRVIYDSAAAHTLVSKDITLCKTGLVTLSLSASVETTLRVVLSGVPQSSQRTSMY